MFKRFGEQPIFNNIANSSSLLTGSKALVGLMKAIYKGTLILCISLAVEHREKHVSGGAFRSKTTLQLGIYSFSQLL